MTKMATVIFTMENGKVYTMKKTISEAKEIVNRMKNLPLSRATSVIAKVGGLVIK